MTDNKRWFYILCVRGWDCKASLFWIVIWSNVDLYLFKIWKGPPKIISTQDIVLFIYRWFVWVCRLLEITNWNKLRITWVIFIAPQTDFPTQWEIRPHLTIYIRTWHKPENRCWSMWKPVLEWALILVLFLNRICFCDEGALEGTGQCLQDPIGKVQ